MWVNTVVGQMEMNVRVSDGLRDAERRRQLFVPQGEEGGSEARGKMAAVICANQAWRVYPYGPT